MDEIVPGICHWKAYMRSDEQGAAEAVAGVCASAAAAAGAHVNARRWRVPPPG